MRGVNFPSPANVIYANLITLNSAQLTDRVICLLLQFQLMQLNVAGTALMHPPRIFALSVLQP